MIDVTSIDNQTISNIVQHGTLIWKKHSLERLMKRNITKETIINTILNGEIVEKYPDDNPYPSYLLFGMYNGKPYHVVIAINIREKICFVITVYQPDSNHFKNDYKTRKK